MRQKRWVGSSPIRKEGMAKVTGKASYIADIPFDDLWHGVTVRSPVARGILNKIYWDPSVPWEEYVIVQSGDIPGKNEVAMIEKDQPYLVKDRINHREEPVVLLAHRDVAALERARRGVTFDISPLPVVLSIENSLAQQTIIWGQDNIFKTYRLEKGNPDAVWEKAHAVVEGTYHTGAQEQLYIENHGVVAEWSEKEGITVWGSMQCPYYVHKAVVHLMGLSAEKVRVIQTETGGGFGGKEDYPSILAGHAALLAYKSKKRIRMLYDRAEDMAATTKRHPSKSHYRTAVDKNGKLLAMEIDFVLDGGAYVTLSPVVLSRGTIHAAGPYACPNVRIRAKAVATNHPPNGAFRGFGAPQSLFALERHMERVAKKLGLSSDEFRRRNFLKKGDTTATGQLVRDGVDLSKLLNEVLTRSQYHQKRRRFQKENRKNSKSRGMGLAAFFHGAGFTGSGERTLASVVAVEVNAKGRVEVLTSNTEIGQGTLTIFSQIAADALEVSVEDIDVIAPDTKRVPNSGPTVASRTCMVVGKLVETSCLEVRRKLIESGYLNKNYTIYSFRGAVKKYLKEKGPLRCHSKYEEPPNIHWDDKTYQGDAYGTYGWAVYVAQVSVDRVTYQATVDEFWAHQEVGKVVHPVLAEGQIEGGVIQGIGYALYEKVLFKEGQLLNNRMTNYIIPSARDVPPIHVSFREIPYAFGPQGAKGIGELPMDGPAPAILNAIEDAVGVSVSHIPCLPEDIQLALGGA